MKPNFSLENVLIVVCDYYQITKQELIEKNRKPHLVRARQMYFYMADSFTDNTSTKTADLIQRNHTTGLYSLQKMKVEKEIYNDIQEEIKEITEKLFNRSELIVQNVDLLRLTESYTKSFS